MRTTAILTLAAWTVSGSVGVGQSKPSFAGKWVSDPASATQSTSGGRGRGMGGSGWGQTFTITQNATTLKIERKGLEAMVTETYALDGSESKNSMPGRPGGPPSVAVSKATWDGAKLVIATAQTMDLNGGEVKVETKRVIWLDGPDLFIETTRSNPMGGDPVVSRVRHQKG